jgi:ankyrin repeat protein
MEVDVTKDNESVINSIDPSQLGVLYHQIISKEAQYEKMEEEESIKKLQNMFVRHNIKINTQDTAGDTLLHLAASCNHKKFISYFLAMGADPHIKNKKGFTPFAQTMTQQLIDTPTILTEKDTNHSRANNLLSKPKHRIIEKNIHRFTVFEHSELLDELLTPLYEQQTRNEPLKLKYIDHALKIKLEDNKK